MHTNQDTLLTDPKLFSNTYISELAWREFWQHIAHHFPFARYLEFQEKRRDLQWVNNPERFDHRKNGTTGYPIVDAGMRQLKATNRMHNRVRMIVASFLTKDLLIDRRRGEQHFADYLIDYDQNVNIGNRQRAASVGADPKPLRIFSPIRQSQRFDPQAEYILKRCPELR
ncbi:MAG: FAD-binding domain-containing protein [Candidatus Peribacteria bacterium]|nr:MAG: FAD-binding domain-containing protein [Candidatus Peribacteria bacterium]